MFEAEARQSENHVNTYHIRKIVWQLKTMLIFTRSPHSGERGNVIVMYGCVCVCVCACVCVCVCHEVSQTRCGRTLRRTAFVLGSFERSIPLVSGGVKSFAVSRDLDLFI